MGSVMAEYKTAEQMAVDQREISVAEFFEKNRHLLGFDNPTKSLLTVIKEGVDNSLDACEEAGILPEVLVKIKQLKQEDRYRITIRDNGPGIVKAQIPRIFGKLLYGSKFYKLSQSRGQQGIGISAAVLYSQLTTSKPTRIVSNTTKSKKPHEFKIRIDTIKNEPQIIEDVVHEKNFPDHGVHIEMEIEGRYVKGARSIDEYIEQTALANPFAKITYHAPDGRKTTYSRVVDKLPRRPKSIKPHPYGVEVGVFERMAKHSKSKSTAGFLSNDFSRVSRPVANQVCKIAKVKPSRKPKSLDHEEIESLWRTLQKTKLMKPPVDCLSPIGESVLEKAIKKDTKADFVAAITRPPSVYRGNPFGIEVCVGFGGELNPKGSGRLVRIANRVPLLYEASSCAITKALKKIDWRHYRVDSQGNLPTGPIIILTHMYSTWIPYTSESKEAIDAYPVILKEIKLALQDCLRKLGRYLSGQKRRQVEKQRQSLFEKYIPEAAHAISKMSGVSKDKIMRDMMKIVKKEKVNGEDVEKNK